MLNAILSGKDPALNIGSDKAPSWRHLLRENEDLVTATLMERLSYLPGEVAWAILSGTYEGQLPAFQMASIDSIEFWPRWAYKVDGRHSVEPDAFIRLTLGDPAQCWDVIFEAKHGTGQYADQWRREQDAYLMKLDEEGDALPDKVVFMALGGLRGRNGVAAARALGEEVVRGRKRDGARLPVEILTVAADWSDMARALTKVEPTSNSAQRIVSDMIEALAVFGYRHLPLSRGLLRVAPFENWQASMDTLASRRKS